MSAGKHTRVAAKNGSSEVAFSTTTTTTDAPLLPIDQIERLRQVAPDKVEWVFKQTELESEHRRSEMRRVNTMVLIESIAGLVFALLIAVAGLAGSIYLAMNGKEITASVIGGATLVGLVTAFLARRGKE